MDIFDEVRALIAASELNLAQELLFIEHDAMEDAWLTDKEEWYKIHWAYVKASDEDRLEARKLWLQDVKKRCRKTGDEK